MAQVILNKTNIYDKWSCCPKCILASDKPVENFFQKFESDSETTLMNSFWKWSADSHKFAVLQQKPLIQLLARRSYLFFSSSRW